MIKIKIIASGSGGNCYLLDNGMDKLLIECGIKIAKIQKALNFKLSGIRACLISHGHKDHCLALPHILRHGIQCYMTAGTVGENQKELESLGYENHHCINTIRSGKPFRVGSYTVIPFETEHDSMEPVGFAIGSFSELVIFITDTAYVKPKFKGATHVLIECNHERSTLNRNVEDCVINHSTATRISEAHMELQTCKNFFIDNNFEELREIYLIHISETNGDPEKFQREIAEITGVSVYI